jgi:hypothetical protein
MRSLCMCSRFLFLVLILALVDEASATQFRKAAYYKTGNKNQAYNVISADFNQDGNLDLAVASFIDGKVSILLGKGDGTFQKPITFLAFAAVALAAGDFDHDGNQDLAVIEYGGTGVSTLGIFLNDGTGHFRKGDTYKLGVESALVVVDDFDQDGHADVAVTNKGLNGQGGNVMVFLGKGDGSLDKPAIYKLPNTPYGLAAGDLNGDGYPDLAVTEVTGNSVVVLLNNGTGKFQVDKTYPVGAGEATGVAIGDLNHDGRADLVVANADSGIDVLLNKGGGKFGKAVLYSHCTKDVCVTGPFAVAIADFNLDGNVDVAAVSIDQHSLLYYGDGNGKFAQAVPIYIWLGGGLFLTAGDFNNDNAPDLAVDMDGGNAVAVLLNTQ